MQKLQSCACWILTPAPALVSRFSWSFIFSSDVTRRLFSECISQWQHMQYEQWVFISKKDFLTCTIQWYKSVFLFHSWGKHTGFFLSVGIVTFSCWSFKLDTECWSGGADADECLCPTSSSCSSSSHWQCKHSVLSHTFVFLSEERLCGFIPGWSVSMNGQMFPVLQIWCCQAVSFRLNSNQSLLL